MKTPPSYWPHGTIAEFARRAEIDPANLSNILHRRAGLSVARAKEFEKISAAVLGEAKRIPWPAWADNRAVRHAAFAGEPLV